MSEKVVYKREEDDRPVERSPRERYIRFDVKLGSGAYKTVYKAYDTDQGIDVAWNAIDIGSLPSTERTRIIQEVQLLQKLEHKNIINFYGSWFSKEKNQVVFITEIMTSGNLKSYIKRVQFVKWKIIKRWCIQILEGLHYLHSQNPPVIHRDLKCDNIFINGNTGDLRIGDLGLSTQLAVHKRSKAQSVLGTPEFMAPELYDENYDEKVDIYAFGMCVLEMVTKEVPYSECINPAQIYKKVTAGIRPKGLQRIVSQRAKDFIELCLSRGNGKIDVSAEYLLDHPFLKPQDDDDQLVEVLDEDKLECEGSNYSNKKAKNSFDEGECTTETLEDELNMESASKSSGILRKSTDRRSTFASLSYEPEAITSTNGKSTTSASNSTATSVTGQEIPSEDKSPGKYHFIAVGSSGVGGGNGRFSRSISAVTPSSNVTAPAAPSTAITGTNSGVPLEPVVDIPLSGKKEDDHHMDKFLASMPGSEIKIQNTRMNIMGGRGHRLELEDPKVSSEDEQEESEENPESDEVKDQEAITQEEPQIIDKQTDDTLPPPVPSPTAHSTESSTLVSAPSSNDMRKRGKRHEMKATKDPNNPHSILLNLRINLDGKSKEIKFPFNLFTESTHKVACELAVDVGILEPDLGDIADSIRFLATEGKINNLPEIDEDVWEEAPEPHSFSMKPLPHVSKMNFMKPNPLQGISQLQLQQQSYGMNGEPPPQPPIVTRSVSHSGLPMSAHVPSISREVEGSYDSNPTRLSPHRRGTIATVSEAAASMIPSLQMSTDDWAGSGATEGRERGASVGSSSDANYLRKVRNYEDRLKIGRSSPYDERESSLEAAIRSEEEKHQREIERFRKKMQEFQEKKARVAFARQERLKQVGVADQDYRQMENEYNPVQQPLPSPTPMGTSPGGGNSNQLPFNTNMSQPSPVGTNPSSNSGFSSQEFSNDNSNNTSSSPIDPRGHVR